MQPRAFILAISLLTVVGATSAEQRTLSLDPEQSTVAFVLGATMHKVRGTLEISSGQVSFDTATGVASGEIVVDARSADTGNTKRDRDMHAKVLESGEFGSIELHPRRIQGVLPEVGEGAMSIEGVMILHGTGHEVSIPLTIVVDGQSVSLTADFEVPYVAWGLRDPSKFLLKVAKHVRVTVQARGTLSE